jgi:glycosyltransferase involved in cell wall biosynthesis
MHILFVTAEYPPVPGGVGAYTGELGRSLAGLGCQVSVLTSSVYDAPDGAGWPIYNEISRWDWRIWRQIGRRARVLGADWVHVQYQTGAYAMHPAINLAPWWWQGSSFRVAWTYHDLRVPYLFPKAGARLRRWVTELPALYANGVIVTNEGDRIALADRRADLAKIPIGSNIEVVAFDDAAIRQWRSRRGYGENELVIGYFGLLNRSKGGLTLVKTLDRLVRSGRDAHLLMIGETLGANDPTNAAYGREVVALIEQLGLVDRVRWTGQESAADVSADLSSCDLLLMPYEDGASLRRGTLMAGLAHGCAIVTTTPQDPLPELVEGRDLLYVAPGDDWAAAQAILRIADDQALAAALRRHAKASSVQFGWEEIAHAHVRLYERVSI